MVFFRVIKGAGVCGGAGQLSGKIKLNYKLREKLNNSIGPQNIMK